MLKDYQEWIALKQLYKAYWFQCYPYQGEYSRRGRPRKYAGKVDLTDYSSFELVTQLSDDVDLYTVVVVSKQNKYRLQFQALTVILKVLLKAIAI